jgi:hypothetical protein
MSVNPLVRQSPGTKKSQLTALQKKPNWIGFLHVRYLCRSHGIPESLRIPVFKISPSNTQWRKLKRPAFRIFYKQGQKCLIFEKVLADLRSDGVIRQVSDFLFMLMRKETALYGSLSVWFEDKHDD